MEPTVIAFVGASMVVCAVAASTETNKNQSAATERMERRLEEHRRAREED